MQPLDVTKLYPNARALRLAPPVGWDQEKDGVCETLSVCRADWGYLSFWRPSWRDMWNMLCGRPIRLSIIGSSHPPVSIDTERL